jgi:hypothetical protein
VDYLFGLLRTEGPCPARSAAGEALAKLGEAARPALPAVGEVFLETLEWDLPWHLADPLVALDPDGSFVVPLFIRVLTEPQFQSRRYPALRALQRHRKRVRPAVPALQALAAGGDQGAASAAREILAALGHSS